MMVGFLEKKFALWMHGYVNNLKILLLRYTFGLDKPVPVTNNQTLNYLILSIKYCLYLRHAENEGAVHPNSYRNLDSYYI